MTSSLNSVNVSTRLLLVESDRPSCERLAAALRMACIDVTLAADATQAITLAQERRPDLFLANRSLADTSGWLLIAKLRFAGLNGRVWLYAPQVAPNDRRWAEYLGIERLFYYGDNRSGFVAAVVAQVRRERRLRTPAVPGVDDGDVLAQPGHSPAA